MRKAIIEAVSSRSFWFKVSLLILAAVIIPACGKSHGSGGAAAAGGGGGGGTGGVDALNDTMPAVNEDDNNVAIAIAILLSNDTGPAGANLTVSGVSATSANGGSVSINGPNVRYSPAPNFNGADSFTYTVTDTVGGGTDTATVSVTVNPLPDSPVAVDDASPANFPNLLEDAAPTAIPVLANDFDPDGGALTITGVTQGSAGGTVVITGGGTGLTYQPAANYSGPDSFTYTIEDPEGNADTAAVAVTITGANDDTHDAVADPGIATVEDTPIAIDVLANDVVPTTDSPWTIAVTTAPTNGTVVIGTSPTFLMTYIPNPDYNGPDSFTYTITDSAGIADSALVSIDVTPFDDAPLAVDDCVFRAKGLGAIVINVLSNDTNLDLALTSVTPSGASHGTVSVGAGPGFLMTYTPNSASFTGTDEFQYTIVDADTDIASGTVRIVVLDVVTASSNLDPGRRFGTSVISLGVNLSSSSGPCHEFAVGAPSQGSEGVVYIVDGDTLAVLQTLTPFYDSGGNGSQEFGTALAVVSNYLYIGAPEYRNGNNHVGAIWGHSIGAATVATSNTYATRGYYERGARLGSIMIAYNSGLAVGIPNRDGANGSIGRVDLYNFWLGDFNRYQLVSNPEPDAGDNFGAALAVGDFVGTVTDDLAIGAPGDGNGGLNATGTVYVFSGDSLGDFLPPDLTISNPSPADGDRFGSALMDIDTDNGGKKELVVGVPFADSGATLDVGRVHIVDLDGGLTFVSVANPDPTANDQFGSVLATLGDGGFLVGVPLNDVLGNLDAGTVYCYSGNGRLSSSFNNPTPALGAQFGASLFASDEPTVLIGAPGASPASVAGAGEVWAHSFCGKLIWALGNGNTLASFRHDNPGTLVSGPTAVTGLAMGDALHAIDFRPSNGQLYGLAFNSGGGSLQIYTINTTTLVATPILTNPPIAVGVLSTVWSMDFNPALDLIHAVSNAAENIAIDPDTMADTSGTALFYAVGDPNEMGASPAAEAVGYGNTVVSTAYVLDSANGVLARMTTPSSGSMTTVGVHAVVSPVGLDICGVDWAFHTDGNSLSELDLATGASSSLGAISGAITVVDIAVQP